MVGHHVEHLAQAVLGQGPAHPLVAERAAQFGVRPVVIEHVVAVRAARHRLQVRRAINVRHAQLGQVVGDLSDPIEPECGLKLQAIGGARNTHRRRIKDAKVCAATGSEAIRVPDGLSRGLQQALHAE